MSARAIKRGNDHLPTDECGDKREKLALPHCGLALTSVYGLEERWNAETYSLPDLLEMDSDQLESSVQMHLMLNNSHIILIDLHYMEFNFMIDPQWLLSCYPEKCRSLPLLLVTSHQSSSWSCLNKLSKQMSNVQLVDAHLPIMYGTHHTKMMIFKYKSGLRFVIHTANLIESDWFQKTQGLYISPVYPLFNGDGPSDSDTHFKADIISYLLAYNSDKLSAWCDLIAKHDLSSARVYVVASVPGRHTASKINLWGHPKLAYLLSSNLDVAITPNWPIVAQFSSIGSLGQTADKWLTGEFASSLSKCKLKNCHSKVKECNVKLVYPCLEDVRLSLEGYVGGGCLPYSHSTAVKQEYLSTMFHRWRSDCHGRSAACPHIKTYLRCNADFDRIAWFLITSANLSKAAWGCFEKNKSQLMIRSYELGVLFLPNCFDQETFSANGKSGLLVPYDLPPIPYEANDKPWIADMAYTTVADSQGNYWQP